MIETIKAYVEGRGSIATLEQAIDDARDPKAARLDVERELNAEGTLKDLFATIPPPRVGLTGVLTALRAAPDPELGLETSEMLAFMRQPLSGVLKNIPEPAGGFSGALSRLKLKLAAAPEPARVSEEDSDIQPGFDSSGTPAAGTAAPKLVERRKTKRGTKVVRMPRHSTTWRDVLAAGKDLPENPNDIPDA